MVGARVVQLAAVDSPKSPAATSSAKLLGSSGGSGEAPALCSEASGRPAGTGYFPVGNSPTEKLAIGGGITFMVSAGAPLRGETRPSPL